MQAAEEVADGGVLCYNTADTGGEESLTNHLGHLPANLQEAVLRAVKCALAEDVGRGDVTSMWTIPAEAHASAHLLSKAEGVLAGLAVAEAVFVTVDPQVVLEILAKDGESISRGQVLATVHGSVRSVLTAERTALNFLQRMSGVATLTRCYVGAVSGTNAVILDTRKTAPGLRLLDKWAVRLGGGQNHRLGLYDMVLIKDNHIAAAGGIAEAVNRVRKRTADQGLDIKVEVEVGSLTELAQALPLNVDRIMLDNMPLRGMREAVRMTAGSVPLEASGGVSLETVRGIAETGVDYISVGALTHSVRAVDISLEIEQGE